MLAKISQDQPFLPASTCGSWQSAGREAPVVATGFTFNAASLDKERISGEKIACTHALVYPQVAVTEEETVVAEAAVHEKEEGVS